MKANQRNKKTDTNRSRSASNGMNRCRICKSKDLKKVFSLGKQPLANQFLKDPIKVKEYPLDLYRCQHCTLLQLGYVVKKQDLYDEYFYIPSVSKTYLKHFEDLAKKITAQLGLKKSSLVVDIGGSDGSLLNEFKKRGMKVINIEPAKNIKVKKGIAVIRDYFTPQIAKTIVLAKGRAKLATATNVFAHMDNLAEFLKGLDILLDEDGVFFAQFPDARNLLAENQFDTIYHEHLSYFTYEPLYHLFANTPFELWQITSDNIHGGSMQIWVRRRPRLLSNFIKNVTIIGRKLQKYLKSEKQKGKHIIGFGAAAKGTVLLNYCGLNNSIIDYIVDGTSYKQGRFIPGVNIPIISEEKFIKELQGRRPPMIVLILAWNFKREIITKVTKMYKQVGLKPIFVIPIPRVEIL